MSSTSLLCWSLFFRLLHCHDTIFNVNIESLVEYDINGDEIPSATFTEFGDHDWTDETLFRPVLSNEGEFSMTLTMTESARDLEYTLNLHSWPWNNNQANALQNYIEFCFMLSSSNAHNLRIESANADSMTISIVKDNLSLVCHTIHYESSPSTQSAYLYFADNDISDYLTTINLANNEQFTADQVPSSVANSMSNAHLPWLFGVFGAIIIVLCIFISLIVYLMKEGFFNDEPSAFMQKKRKRKKSAPVLFSRSADTKRVSVPSHRTSTNSMHSSCPSPQKNLRINITYHSPKASHPNSAMDDMEDERPQETVSNVHGEQAVGNDAECSVIIKGISAEQEGKVCVVDVEHGKLGRAHHNHHQTSTFTTLDSKRVNYSSRDSVLMDHDQLDANGDDTPTAHSYHDTTDFEESMVQFVIKYQNDQDEASTPVPFV